MTIQDDYKPGAWNVTCDRCGRKFKSTELRRDWQGWMVCERDWETRHPQDFVKAGRPETAPGWTRPQPTWNLIGPDAE